MDMGTVTCLGPLEQRGAPSEGAQAGHCTFMWTLHRNSSVSGPALPGSYSWKKRGAKRKEAKPEREELTARRDSWGHSHSVGTACREGRGHRCPPSSHPAAIQLPSPDAAYPALGGLQVELVADAGQGVHGSAEDWGGGEGVGSEAGLRGHAALPGPQAPLTFDVAAGDDTFHGTGTRTGTGRARGGFAPAAPGSRPRQETTPLSGVCGLGHAPSWFSSGLAASHATLVVPSPPRRCRLSPEPLRDVPQPPRPVPSRGFRSLPRPCFPGFPRPPSQASFPLAGSVASSRPCR